MSAIQSIIPGQRAMPSRLQDRVSYGVMSSPQKGPELNKTMNRNGRNARYEY
jgi:hypothetical protein